jgi:hypothetical protein
LHNDVCDDEAAGVAPGGVDGIIHLGVGAARVDNVTDVESELGGLGHGGVDECVCDFVAVRGDVGLSEEAASDNGLLVRGLVFEHIDVEFEECGERLGVGIVGHLGCVQLLVQWCENLLKLLLVHLGADERSNVQTLRARANLKVHKHAMLTVVVGQVVEDVNTLGEQLGIVGVGGVDVENRASGRNLWECLDSNGNDNSERAGTAALESPEEVRVFLRVGGHVLALSSNGVEREYVVSAHSVDAGKWAVSTSLDVAATPTNSLELVSKCAEPSIWCTYRALSTNNDHLGALSKALAEQLAALDTSTNDSRSALPVTRSSVLFQELDVPEAVGVDDERTVSGRTAPVFLSVLERLERWEDVLHEIMTSVTNDQSKVAFSCKVHTSLDLLLGSCHNDIFSVKALCTRRRRVVGRHAGIVRLERPKLGNGVIGSIIALASTSIFPRGVVHTAIAHWPSWLAYPHTSPHRTRWSRSRSPCSRRHQVVWQPAVRLRRSG